MQKRRRAVFCYYILRFDNRLLHWLLLISDSLRRDGWLTVGETNRQRVAMWLSDMFFKKLDFEIILHVLAGDAFFERNKRDVVRLEKEVGKKITDLWDTDPIFAKYPHLKKLGRNKEFEKVWPQIKSQLKAAQNQRSQA